MFNSSIECSKGVFDVEFKSMKTINTKNESCNERDTYELLTGKSAKI